MFSTNLWSSLVLMSHTRQQGIWGSHLLLQYVSWIVWSKFYEVSWKRRLLASSLLITQLFIRVKNFFVKNICILGGWKHGCTSVPVLCNRPRPTTQTGDYSRFVHDGERPDDRVLSSHSFQARENHPLQRRRVRRAVPTGDAQVIVFRLTCCSNRFRLCEGSVVWTESDSWSMHQIRSWLPARYHLHRRTKTSPHSLVLPQQRG